MRSAPIIPAGFSLRPIDDEARDGRFHLVFDNEQFAVVRWCAQGWTFSSEMPLDFEPTSYRVALGQEAQP